MLPAPDSNRIEAFWCAAQAALPRLSAELPEAWAFGAGEDQADELLALVLNGTKTATASSLWDYEHAGDPIPETGELSIILDGRAVPRALIKTTAIELVPFEQVGEAHAFHEGEGDRTLQYWREAHERFWRAHSENPRGFEPDMPVVCERFELLWKGATSSASLL